MSANGAYQQQSSTSIFLSIPHIAKHKQYGYFFSFEYKTAHSFAKKHFWIKS